MSNRTNSKGFSLTEVLLAIGVLSVGMLFVAGTFPVGIYFSTLATERTLAAEIADEAFAKVRLYAAGDDEEGDYVRGKNLRFNRFINFDSNDPVIFDLTRYMDADTDEFLYPSVGQSGWNREYSWSALCRRISRMEVYDDDLNTTDPNDPNFIDPNLVDSNSVIVPRNFDPAVQIAVFVCRKTGAAGRRYYMPNNKNYGQVDWGETSDMPLPIKVKVSGGGVKDNELKVDDGSEKIFFSDGSIIMDDVTGRVYRVLERYRDDGTGRDEILLLDRRWEQGTNPNRVWVVPLPIDGGRNPCVGIYQRVIKF